MLQAVFWDMDGTIVDTEPCWFAAEAALLHRFGVDWTDEQAAGLVGNALPVSAAILQAAGADLPIRDIVDELLRSVIGAVSESIVWRPGARELLAELRTAGIPCVMVTMSEAPLAEVVANELPDGTFAFLITGDMVVNGKPHPEPYLRAAEELARLVGAVSMNHVVAIEDSLPGVESARASGAITVGVPNMVALPDHPATTTWSSLRGKTVNDLNELVAARTGAVETV